MNKLRVFDLETAKRVIEQLTGDSDTPVRVRINHKTREVHILIDGIGPEKVRRVFETETRKRVLPLRTKQQEIER
jgi:hypothetical protein